MGKLAASASVVVDRPAVEAGLALLNEAASRWRDAFEGRRAGGGVFTSFDRDAVALVIATGGDARLLSG